MPSLTTNFQASLKNRFSFSKIWVLIKSKLFLYYLKKLVQQFITRILHPTFWHFWFDNWKFSTISCQQIDDLYKKINILWTFQFLSTLDYFAIKYFDKLFIFFRYNINLDIIKSGILQLWSVSPYHLCYLLKPITLTVKRKDPLKQKLSTHINTTSRSSAVLACDLLISTAWEISQEIVLHRRWWSNYMLD